MMWYSSHLSGGYVVYMLYIERVLVKGLVKKLITSFKINYYEVKVQEIGVDRLNFCLEQYSTIYE